MELNELDDSNMKGMFSMMPRSLFSGASIIYSIQVQMFQNLNVTQVTFMWQSHHWRARPGIQTYSHIIFVGVSLTGPSKSNWSIKSTGGVTRFSTENQLKIMLSFLEATCLERTPLSTIEIESQKHMKTRDCLPLPLQNITAAQANFTCSI